MIRPAKFSDVPRIVELMEDMHAKSKYWHLDTVDNGAAHRLVAQCVQRHGHTNDGGALVMVSEAGSGTVEGFFVGILDRLYHIGKKLCANDVFLYCSDKAPKIDMLRLFEAYISWAKNNPKVIAIKGSWTDAVEGADRMAGVYLRKGFALTGQIWERIEVEPQQAYDLEAMEVAR